MMKYINYILLALAALVYSEGRAQSYYDDDIYYDASKAKKEKSVKQGNKPAGGQSLPKVQGSYVTTSDGMTYFVDESGNAYPVRAANIPGSDLYVVDSGDVRDVDEYNRRYQGTTGIGSAPTDSVLREDFANTRLIERFSNPDIVIGSGDADLISLYEASQPEVNIYVGAPSYSFRGPGFGGYYSLGWGGWYDGWGYPYYGYPYYGYPYYSYNWYSPYYGWYSPYWYGGWGPSWGLSWGWGPAPHPGHGPGWHPGPSFAGNSHRPTQSGVGNTGGFRGNSGAVTGRPMAGGYRGSGGVRGSQSVTGTTTTSGSRPSSTGTYRRPSQGSIGTVTSVSPSTGGVRGSSTSGGYRTSGGSRPSSIGTTSGGSGSRPSNSYNSGSRQSSGSSYSRPSSGSSGSRSSGSSSGGGFRGSSGGSSGGSRGGGRR